MSGHHLVAEGITNPPIDELLTQSDSKYKLVLFAAKRARQINAYYSQLGEGLLDHVGPLVETTVQEKPLTSPCVRSTRASSPAPTSTRTPRPPTRHRNSAETSYRTRLSFADVP